MTITFRPKNGYPEAITETFLDSHYSLYVGIDLDHFDRRPLYAVGYELPPSGLVPGERCPRGWILV